MIVLNPKIVIMKKNERIKTFTQCIVYIFLIKRIKYIAYCCVLRWGSFCVQNPENKREIICDEKLKTIFDGRDRVGFLEIAKLLAPHFVKTS